MSEGLGIRRDGWLVLTWIGKGRGWLCSPFILKDVSGLCCFNEGDKTGFLMAVTKGGKGGGAARKEHDTRIRREG